MNASPIKEMFDRLVPEYDRFNRWSSLGLDQMWRREVAALFLKNDHVIDIGTGTGDLALALIQRGCKVTGVDFSEKMIVAAQEKFKNVERVKFNVASADDLPYEPYMFDGLTSAFVIRNLHKGKILSQSLREFYRVLKPGGKMVHLELTRPPKGIMKQGHKLYLSYVLPLFGKAFFGQRWPENYLSQTIEKFHSPAELCQMIRWAGFNRVTHHSICGGLAGIFVGVKCSN